MHFNLDSVIANFKPWQLVILVDGKDRATRPLTLQMRETIVSAGSQEDLRNAVKNLFVDPPDTSGWEDEHLQGVIQSVLSYKELLATKNSQAVAVEVAAAMRSAATPGR